MTVWERKRVGAIVDAVRFLSSGIGDPVVRAQLSEIRQHCEEVERGPSVPAHVRLALQQRLCSFCKQLDLLNCDHHVEESGCDLAESTQIESQFGPRHRPI